MFLALSSREIFILENIDSDNTIKKSPDNSTITVTAPQLTIVIKLDERTKQQQQSVGSHYYYIMVPR